MLFFSFVSYSGCLAGWHKQTWWLFSPWHLARLQPVDLQPESPLDSAGHSGAACALCLWSPSPPWWRSTRRSGTLSLAEGEETKKERKATLTIISNSFFPMEIMQDSTFLFLNSPCIVHWRHSLDSVLKEETGTAVQCCPCVGKCHHCLLSLPYIACTSICLFYKNMNSEFLIYEKAKLSSLNKTAVSFSVSVCVVSTVSRHSRAKLACGLAELSPSSFATGGRETDGEKYQLLLAS